MRASLPGLEAFSNVIFYGARGSGKTKYVERLLLDWFGGDELSVNASKVKSAKSSDGEKIEYPVLEDTRGFFTFTKLSAHDKKDSIVLEDCVTRRKDRRHVFVLDNIDFLTTKALLFLRSALDLPDVSFVMCTRNIDAVLEPLVSRCHVVRIVGPTVSRRDFLRSRRIDMGLRDHATGPDHLIKRAMEAYASSSEPGNTELARQAVMDAMVSFDTVGGMISFSARKFLDSCEPHHWPSVIAKAMEVSGQSKGARFPLLHVESFFVYSCCLQTRSPTEIY